MGQDSTDRNEKSDPDDCDATEKEVRYEWQCLGVEYHRVSVVHSPRRGQIDRSIRSRASSPSRHRPDFGSAHVKLIEAIAPSALAADSLTRGDDRGDLCFGHCQRAATRRQTDGRETAQNQSSRQRPRESRS
jgi:hypothetical protein